MRHNAVDVVVAGHICLDMIPEFGQAETSLGDLLVPGKLVNVGHLTTSTGGPVSNTGLALHRLGFSVRLMGKVGDDVVGRAIVELLQQHDPALSEGMIVTEDSSSSYTVVISPPGVDRVFLHCPGANDTFGPEDVDYAKLEGAHLFHFGYPPLMRRMFADGGEELASLLSRAKERHVTTSLDMARPDPASEAGGADWRTILERALPHVDVFLPSFDETLFMLDRERFEQIQQASAGGDLNAQADGVLLRDLADELIAMGAAVVGFKLGTQGLYLRTTEHPVRLEAMGKSALSDAAEWLDRELLAPCFEVEVVGTTGSGDCTIAGFLGGLLNGLGPEDTMTAAVAVGACNVESADATSGIPHWSVVQERLASGWGRQGVSCHLEGWTWDDQNEIWRPGSTTR